MAAALSAAGPAEEPGRAGLPDPGRFADLGSGGGVPALVLLERWPRSEAVLIEVGARRAAFLRQSVAALGWQDRVRVLEERAEVSGQRTELRASFPLVTARSFARPAIAAECAAPLLAVGGLLVVSEPPEEADRWSEAGLAELGMRALQRRESDGFHFQLLRQVDICASRYPRRTGVPERRPLF
jgi:16S rRNA (guanine527-N7)-methyltransferase